MKAIAYDHAQRGRLQQLSQQCADLVEIVGFAPHCKQEDAVDLILSHTSPCILVHLDNDDKAWARLLLKSSSARTIIRFSRDRLASISPYGPHKNVLNCAKKIGSLSESDFRYILIHALDPDKLKSLKSGAIHRDLQGLFSFVEPHTLRALFLLSQSILMQRASDPPALGHSEAVIALAMQPPQASIRHNLALRSVFWRVLDIDAARTGDAEYLREQSLALRWKLCEELGIAAIPRMDEPAYSAPPLPANAPILDGLVECIFTGKLEHEIDIPKVPSAFTFLRSRVEGTA